MQSSVLGILAGKGDLPFIAARNAIKAGVAVRIFYFTDQLPPADLEGISEPIILTKLYSSFFKAMKKQNVDRLLLLGKATRDILFNKPRFDLRTLYMLFRMSSKSDTSIFESVSKEIEKQGITIIPQTIYLNSLQLKPGRYGKKLSARELRDVEFGLFYASELNRLDVGQSVVVGDLAVLALEAAEGTDKCIERGGKLYRKGGAVVCKLPKANHDLRFDIPTIGSTTLESMKGSGCRVIAFRSDCTIILDPETLLKQALKEDITLLSIDVIKPQSIAELKILNFYRKR